MTEPSFIDTYGVLPHPDPMPVTLTVPIVGAVPGIAADTYLASFAVTADVQAHLDDMDDS